MPIEFKNLPDKKAIKYFKSKGYTFGFDWRDVSAQTHAHAFTVAKVTRLDILQDIRTAMDDAIKKGLTPQQFKKNLAPILQAKGWWGRKEMMDPLTGEIKKVQLGSHRRLKTIFDVNMRTSHAAGKWDRMQRTKKSRPYLRYVAIQDGRTRQQHSSWHGTVLPIDHQFWITHYPPNGWRCRCTVQQLSDRDLKRYGHEVSNEPLIQTQGHVNKRTGEILDVPKGIDPGFANNVGLSAMRAPIDPARYTVEALGHESARLAVAQPDFETFVGGTVNGTFPVGYVEADLARAIGAKVRRVDISRDTVQKQMRTHPELTVAEYRLLPDIMAYGRVVKDGRNHLAMHYLDGRLYYAVIKSTGSGKAMFLSSLRRADKADLARVERRGKIIRDWVKK